jgi:hypothetical protein
MVTVVLVLAFSSAGFAQRPADLSGVWQKATTLSAGDARWVTPTTDPIPFQEWTREIREYGSNEQEAGKFRPELNPRISECFPPDPHFLMSNEYPFEIVQSPSRALFLFEWGHWVRQVWLNEELTDDVDVAWMGNSFGKWDGDTLVIETIAIDDRNSYAGFIHTDEMRITERLRRVDPNTMINTRTFQDPKAYTMPWTDTVVYKLQPSRRITPRQQCDQTFKKEFEFFSD